MVLRLCLLVEVSMLAMPPHMPMQCTPPSKPAERAASTSGGVSMLNQLGVLRRGCLLQIFVEHHANGTHEHSAFGRYGDGVCVYAD